MFDWCFDRIDRSARWLVADIKRTHAAMFLIDSLVVILCWIILTDIYVLYGQSQDLLSVPRGKKQWILAGLCFPMIHYALTPWGQRWIKRSAQSFSVAILVVSIGGAFLGFALTDHARTQAVLAGYQSCDQTFLEDLRRDDETLVAPGVLCPPTSSNGKPYPPPD
ncbi:hypothetical protein SAMN05444141_101912 [Pseudovibrio denitrificans]|uniref:Uncharacterized protein n=1 Tax=Pseudovibrio denitrificans TaxID=258256 RepID=A0A1I6YJS8_9HYPH|nr:hypothetical protein [Pseudovibrio denitrificans]SFT50481.1 hypothetical protein SAMN05444141_101912 [Pseudovibrio denitrificans]